MWKLLTMHGGFHPEKPKAVPLAERGRPRNRERRSHYPRWNSQNPRIHTEDGPKWGCAKWLCQAAETQWGGERRKETLMEGHVLRWQSLAISFTFGSSTRGLRTWGSCPILALSRIALIWREILDFFLGILLEPGYSLKCSYHHGYQWCFYSPYPFQLFLMPLVFL